MSTPAELITRGNDYYLRVNLYKKLSDGTTEPFDLTVVDYYKGSIKYEYSEADLATSIGLLEGTKNSILIDASNLALEQTYVVEITGSLDSRKFRCAEKGILGVTEYNNNATITWDVLDGAEGVDLDMTFQLMDAQAVVGKNAYELAVEQGYTGTLQDYLEEMIDNGESAGAAREAAQAANEAAQRVENELDAAVEIANQALANSNTAISTANQAATNANSAAQSATTAAAKASAQAYNAEQAASSASTAAIDATNKMSQLEQDYISTKNQLTQDYNSTKSELSDSYRSTTTDLTNQFTTVRTNLENNVNEMISELQEYQEALGNYKLAVVENWPQSPENDIIYIVR